MSVIKTVAILALALSAAAGVTVVPRAPLTISPDAPDGFYVSEVDSEGHRQTLRLVARDLNDTAILETRKDKQGDVKCKNQYVLNWDDMNLAQQGLIERFKDGGSFKDKDTLYKKGSAVAYGCNYGKGQTITGSWLAAQFAAIATHCGSLSPGWVTFPDWKASYGIDNSGNKVC